MRVSVFPSRHAKGQCQRFVQARHRFGARNWITANTLVHAEHSYILLYVLLATFSLPNRAVYQVVDLFPLQSQVSSSGQSAS